MSPRRLFAAALLLASIFAAPATAGDEDGVVRRAARGEVAPISIAEAHVARVLRAARTTPKRPANEIVDELCAPGPVLIGPLLKILTEGAIPALDFDDAAQKLSAPQRDFILGALMRWDPLEAIDAAEARMAVEADAQRASAALWVYSAVGDARHLRRVVELALLPPREAQLGALEPTADDTPDSGPSAPILEAFRCAATGILARDSKGYDGLSRRIERCPSVLHEAWVEAIGCARDPRGLEALARLLVIHPQLAESIVPLARTLGPSAQFEINADMARAVRPCLFDARPTLCAAAARMLAELEDEDAVPRLIELLESDSATIREAALWSLRKLSRLDYPAKLELWSGWFAEESRWWSVEGQRWVDRLSRGTGADRAAAIGRLAGRSLYRDEIGAEVAQALQDRDARVRRRACEALGQLGLSTAYDALLGALDDEDESVREAARAALGLISGTSLPPEPALCRVALRL